MSLARRIIIGNFILSALFAMLWCGWAFVSDIKHWNQVSRDRFRPENEEFGVLCCMLLEGGLVVCHIRGCQVADTDGPRKTAHYAICTGFMALGMMIPGLWSGWLADRLGYRRFFVWVICSALPGLTMALLLKVDPHFGKK